MNVKRKFGPADETHAMTPGCWDPAGNGIARNKDNEPPDPGGTDSRINGGPACTCVEYEMNFCKLEQRMAAMAKENEDLTRAYNAVLESEREHYNFFLNTREAIAVFDGELRLLKANPALLRLLGYSHSTEIQNFYMERIFADPGILDDLLKELLFRGNADDFETVLCRKGSNDQWPTVIGNGFVHFDGSGRIKHFEFAFTDVTKRKELEAQLLQAQKLEAIGTLAGGVAHDFNNLLMGIQGRATLIAMDLSHSHPHLEHTGAIEAHIKSAKMLTGQLLGLARGGKYQVSPMDINQLVRKSATLFGRTKKDLWIHFALEEGPAVVDADRSQMEQVLLNLLINAWQAMPNGGKIFLDTDIVVLDEGFCNLHRIKPGPYVRVRVRDEGVGLDQATRKRIFDPFFTTKEKTRGTGLGLASAYGIIKNHGGVITVESELGRGCTFDIFLPLSEKGAVPTVVKNTEPHRGSERILLVDDEDLIIDTGRIMLERLGYSVVVARGGWQAVETVKSSPNEIDLVILDMIMPDMDGGETFGHIREIAPDMRVMFCSGYAFNRQTNHIMKKACCGFIQKPFTLAELSKNIRKMLNGRSSEKNHDAA